MLSWSSKFNICCFLDNQQYISPYNSFECVLGVGILKSFEPAKDFFSSLSHFLRSNDDWILGHFNYEINSKILELPELAGPGSNEFPECFLFVPEIIILLKSLEVKIGVINRDPSSILSELRREPVNMPDTNFIDFKNRISKEAYINKISQLKKHIRAGDCYEINFCQEFYANAKINPASVYSKIIKISPNPFSAFYRVNDNYLLCASPERFLKKAGNKVIAQPIKGTSARNSFNAVEDEASKKQLKESEKDKSENVMIVDLVRNDLSKICEEGSVTVEELFAVYSFPHVHQMVSTITGIVKNNILFSDVFNATFPMGSMTGAPKRKVIELIRKYEPGKRGIYSGTVGYISPEKDFDFNVVIRSLIYNNSNHNLSYYTGSAITASSDPEKEYEECMLKGRAIVEALTGN